MSAPVGDDENSELSKYAPKRLREQPPMPAAERPYVASAPTAPSSTDVHQDRRTTSEFASGLAHLDVASLADLNAELRRRMAAGQEPVPEPPRRPEDRELTLIGRIAVVVTFAALVALLAVFAKPLWQDARALLNADSQTLQAS